jgi:tetratricopeptide (TPR) repeat protein
LNLSTGALPVSAHTAGRRLSTDPPLPRRSGQSVAGFAEWEEKTATELHQQLSTFPLDRAADHALATAALKLAELGHAAEAEHVLRSRIELHPEDFHCRYNLAKVLLLTGRADEAIAMAREARKNGLEPILANDAVAKGLLLKGEPEHARAALLEGRQLRPRTLSMVTHILCLPLKHHVEDSPDEVYPARDMAEFYGLRGNADRVFKWLDQAIGRGDNLEVSRLLRSPFIAPICNDPRWLPVLERLNLKPEQLVAFRLDPSVFAQRQGDAAPASRAVHDAPAREEVTPIDRQANPGAAAARPNPGVVAITPIESRGRVVANMPKEP